MKEPSSTPSDDLDGTPMIHTGYDWAQTLPTFAVLEAVSDAEHVQPTDLPPLRFSVDPDALDALFQRAPTGPTDVRVDLSYAGHEVTVASDGSVVVTPWQEVD